VLPNLLWRCYEIKSITTSEYNRCRVQNALKMKCSISLFYQQLRPGAIFLDYIAMI